MSDNPLRIVPLGGLGEIGQNIMALEFNDEILIIDSGILFTEGDLPGVDFAIPDITYLLENRDKLLAILITTVTRTTSVRYRISYPSWICQCTHHV